MTGHYERAVELLREEWEMAERDSPSLFDVMAQRRERALVFAVLDVGSSLATIADTLLEMKAASR